MDRTTFQGYAARKQATWSALLPGGVLSLAAGGLAVLLQHAESHLFGAVWVEALVLAIIIGCTARYFWTPGRRWDPGMGFAAKYPLEIAIVLLGATVDAQKIIASGPLLLCGIAVVVLLAIPVSVMIGRMMGLPHRMAILVACGNAICGNSAIIAIAPVIGADCDEVATSIGFTAVLGVAVVFALPIAGLALQMDSLAFGALAGMTVYAVPQVIAAASPLGQAAVQMGTLVKLVRVLMLGPVCLLLSLAAPLIPAAPGPRSRPHISSARPAIHMVPWFIVGFIVLMACRSLGLVPDSVAEGASVAATWLTIIAMAALGLGVDVRAVARAGFAVTATVIMSLAVLGLLSLALLWIALPG